MNNRRNLMPVRSEKVDQLYVEIYADRQAMGVAASQYVAAWIRQVLNHQERVSMVFAAAPSQNEFLAALAQMADIEWERVIAFHMDEYIGLANSDPESFTFYLRDHIFRQVQPGVVHYLDGTADPESERLRYTKLLEKHPPDIVCAGIGENGHLAFNDPPAARFDDPEHVRVVTPPFDCRQQQVHDGSFAQLDDVPTHALTLTIPALMQARYISCVVPGQTKTDAVTRALRGPVSPDCPASILRTHTDAVLILDTSAAADL